MKRVLCWGIALATFLSGSAYAKDPAPFRFSLVNPWYTPAVKTVHGLDLGLISSRADTVVGAQLALAYGRIDKKALGVQWALVSKSQDFDGAKWGVVSLSRNVRGYNSAFVCLADGFTGYQTGFYAKCTSLTGVQFSLVNVADNVSGLQLGIVNYARKMNGVQVGLANIIRESTLPFMILVNAKFE